jgi:hypothetical protein
MPLFMHQVAYSPEGWTAIISNPQNRIEAVRSAIEKLGGKVVSGWLSSSHHSGRIGNRKPEIQAGPFVAHFIVHSAMSCGWPTPCGLIARGGCGRQQQSSTRL